MCCWRRTTPTAARQPGTRVHRNTLRNLFLGLGLPVPAELEIP